MKAWGPWYVIAITALYAAGMLGYEALALSRPDEHATISEMVWRMASGHRWAAALTCIAALSAFGLLMGHFFFTKGSN